MRTIIIDDNKQAVKDLNERLDRFSEVEVVAVEHSGLDGLARVSELQPDLLFLDVQLPIFPVWISWTDWISLPMAVAGW